MFIILVQIALGNILKFRKKNWQFDFIGGIIYFLLAFSMFPQCKLDHILQDDTFSGHLKSFFRSLPRKRKFTVGILHFSAHLSAALILMLLLELGIDTCIRHKLLATSGYHTLCEWYRYVESEHFLDPSGLRPRIEASEHFPDPSGLRPRIEQWTLGLYPACIKYLMSAFDIPEAFSSLRTANYKSFTRFHINLKGDLEVFTLAVDKVPKEWKLDPSWEGESKQPPDLSHHQWRSRSCQHDPVNTVKIVDHFVIEQTVTPKFEAVNGSVSH
ncbi:hypothetical protein SASPL_158129 [Salvia splendens]|uniref:Uncharacterized protein n=1 Tax=Salvia splendens TaxID=180675 RepID=A0A8X8VTS7_SALSN|nr:hypothetical protein SASPL_158129 [Salvia splendens]